MLAQTGGGRARGHGSPGEAVGNGSGGAAGVADRLLAGRGTGVIYRRQIRLRRLRAEAGRQQLVEEVQRKLGLQIVRFGDVARGDREGFDTGDCKGGGIRSSDRRLIVPGAEPIEGLPVGEEFVEPPQAVRVSTDDLVLCLDFRNDGGGVKSARTGPAAATPAKAPSPKTSPSGRRCSRNSICQPVTRGFRSLRRLQAAQERYCRGTRRDASQSVKCMTCPPCDRSS